MVFWTDGKTFRNVGAFNSSAPFPMNPPTPSSPVLGPGPDKAYDMNGNWLLHVQRIAGDELVGFTHVENHHFNCSGPYAEWNAAAVVRSSDNGQSWQRMGLAVADPQPCQPAFGGSGFSSVLPDMRAGKGFIAFGGCSGYRSSAEDGAAGSWMRYYNGSFSLVVFNLYIGVYICVCP